MVRRSSAGRLLSRFLEFADAVQCLPFIGRVLSDAAARQEDLVGGLVGFADAPGIDIAREIRIKQGVGAQWLDVDDFAAAELDAVRRVGQCSKQIGGNGRQAGGDTRQVGGPRRRLGGTIEGWGQQPPGDGKGKNGGASSESGRKLTCVAPGTVGGGAWSIPQNRVAGERLCRRITPGYLQAAWSPRCFPPHRFGSPRS